MPVRWSTHAVAQAVDEVEKLLAQAQVYLDETKKRTEQAQKIPNLPGYMDQRLVYLIMDIERFTERAKADIASVRNNIPEEALKREQVIRKGLFD